VDWSFTFWDAEA
jgi:hypothetical protein